MALEKHFTGCPHLKNNGGSRDIDILAEHTPLFLYVLLEAMTLENGRCLGVLGSQIVGEVLARTLLVSAQDTQSGIADWQTYFETVPPSTMPELLNFLEIAESHHTK